MNTAFGFNADASANDAARTGFGTDFAKSKGLFIDVPSSVTGKSYWWLRSPGRTAQFAGAVSCFNTIKANDNWEITYTDVGIRPVFNLDLSKITKTTSIKLSPASLTWPVGKSSTVTVITTPGNATLKGVTWSSSNTAVATVSGTGKITAKSVGISTIMAGAKDGSGKTAACTIAVVPPAPASLTAVKSTSTSVKLTWSKVTGVTGYEVYRSTIKTGTYSKVVSLSGNTILIAGLSTGRTYYFKVRAYKTFGSVPFKSPFTSIKSVAL